MNGFLTDAATGLNSTLGNFVFCGLIAVGAAFLYFVRFQPHARKLAKCLTLWAAELSRIKSPLAFTAQFEDLNSRLAEDSILGNPWIRFRASLLLPRPTEPRQTIRTPVDPEVHFSPESLFEPVLNLRFFSAVPNYLTGAGILGTFIGLVAGIYLAQDGLNDPDITVVKSSLQHLLRGASLAFMTSIVGLICSIAFSVAEKRRLHSLVGTLADWNEKLSSLIEHISLEQLALRQTEETTRQTIQLERFNTDLAVSLADSLQDRLSSSFGPMLERLVLATEAVVTNQANAQEELLRDLVGQFKASLSGAAGSEMRELQAAFRQLNDGLNGTLSGLRAGQEQLVSSTTKLTDGLAHALGTSLTELREQTVSMVANLVSRLDSASADAAMSVRSSSDSAASLLTTASSRVAEALAGLDGVMTKTDQLLRSHAGAAGEMSQVAQRLEGAHRHFEESAKPIAEALTQLRQATATIATVGQNIAEAAGATKSATESIRQSTLFTQASWENYATRFGEVDKTLARAFEQIQKAQSAHVDKVKSFAEEFDHELARALQNLSAVVGELAETVEEMQKSREVAR